MTIANKVRYSPLHHYRPIVTSERCSQWKSTFQSEKQSVPGIHFVHGRQARNGAPTFKAMLSELLHDEQYRAEVLFSDELVSLGATRYPEYPIAVWDDADYFIVLEGKLYGLNDKQLYADLRSLCSLLLQDVFEAVKDWLLAHDGEYLVLVHDKRTLHWALVNDALGRLPVYYGRVGETDILSRELRFVAMNDPQACMDRMAMAQYLLLDCPHGERTLLEAVDRLPPSTLLHWSSADEPVIRRQLHSFNLEPEETGRSLTENAEHLVTLFTQACRDRAATVGESVLSLSGGLDSRAVAAGLQRTGGCTHAMTFEDALGCAMSEVEVAREVAEKLKLDWQVVPLPRPTGRDIRQHMSIKGGMNYVAQAFGHSFLREIVRQFGRGAIFMSGDGGGTTLPNLTPESRLKEGSDVVRYYLRRYQVLPLNLVTELTGIIGDEIIHELISLIESYPETSYRHKYVHLMLYCRRMRWAFEGEDCNRVFLWATTPFYAQRIFAAAMSIPNELKRGHRLYREFLEQLSPIAAEIVDVNRGLTITSPSYERRQRLIARLNRYPLLAQAARKLLRGRSSYSPTSATIRCLNDQILPSVVSEYVDPAAIKKLLDHCHKYTREAMDNLLTVTAATEMLTGAECTLDRYLDDEF